MKVFLDGSPAKVADFTTRFGYSFGQLQTPLTHNKLAGVEYGLDNGCFAVFHEDRWRNLMKQATGNSLCRFVCVPDIVGDAARTAELFEHFRPTMPDVPAALVLQDGIEHQRIPWSEIAAVFVGGSDAFKFSPAALAACKAARMLGKWVHIGRVNSFQRASQWATLADSCDGSGISRFDETMARVLAALMPNQSQLEIET